MRTQKAILKSFQRVFRGLFKRGWKAEKEGDGAIRLKPPDEEKRYCHCPGSARLHAWLCSKGKSEQAEVVDFEDVKRLRLCGCGERLIRLIVTASDYSLQDYFDDEGRSNAVVLLRVKMLRAAGLPFDEVSPSARGYWLPHVRAEITKLENLWRNRRNKRRR